jgi:hypothetical protein
MAVKGIMIVDTGDGTRLMQQQPVPGQQTAPLWKGFSQKNTTWSNKLKTPEIEVCTHLEYTFEKQKQKTVLI